MKYFGIFLLIIVIIIAATIFITKQFEDNTQQNSEAMIERFKQELIYTDNKFYSTLKNEGIEKAIKNFAATGVILMRQEHLPIIGKPALENFYLGKDTAIIPLKHYPIKVEVSSDGKLGYTFGNWEYILNQNGKKDTTHGNYVTIWQKQADGTWKYVLEGNTNTSNTSQIDSTKE